MISSNDVRIMAKKRLEELAKEFIQKNVDPPH